MFLTVEKVVVLKPVSAFSSVPGRLTSIARSGHYSPCSSF